MTDAAANHIEKARKWVDELQPTGGTAIDAALTAALKFRPDDSGRTFTVVFFTDGLPTVGETNPETIVKNVISRNSTNTRMFTFGVGDDVNAAMLDRLADETRAVSTYVRPAEDIEVKVSGLYGKISHPVLTDLKLKATGGAQLTEMYPTQLPDLFHGGQIVVLSRYKGHGSVALTLTGKVGGADKVIVYEIDLPRKTDNDRAFVEGLWARRKVGYLLDQIRNNGENKELVDEVVKLAKKHGITTPYTSYLLVPDSTPMSPPVVQSPPLPAGQPGRINYAPTFTAPKMKWSDGIQAGTQIVFPDASDQNHGYQINGPVTASPQIADRFICSPSGSTILPQQGIMTGTGLLPPTAQTGTQGVDLALQLNELKTADQASVGESRPAMGRTFVQLNGVWTDQALTAEAKTVKVKVLSDVYFLLLKKHPELREVFQLGQRVVWVTPSGTVLVIGDDGNDTMSEDEIEKLFVAKK